MKKFTILSIICLFSLQCEKGWLREIVNPTFEGCNIPKACNYNPDVNKFDDSCEYVSCVDCLGMQHGVATLDSCGTCDAVVSINCKKDCQGVWGGYKILDCLGECDGPNLLDFCNVCDADPENDCVADCAGILDGSAVKDECDICNGNGKCDCGDGSTSCECCCPADQERDCSGECDGSAVLDECGICGGDNVCLPPDLFSHNQSTLFAYYFVFSAYDYSGEYLEANQDWIGVFNGDVCVGAKLWSGGPTDVPAMGDDGNDYSAGYLNDGDMPRFKIYDASENTYNFAITNENFVFQPYEVNNILRMDIYVDCLGMIGGTAEIDNCGICNGDNDCEGVDCTDNPSDYCQDLSVLQEFIDNSSATINMNMDYNGNGEIEPLELGTQNWINGSITLFGGYFFKDNVLNFDFCNLSGEIPTSIGNMKSLQRLELHNNQLRGAISESVGSLTNLTRLDLAYNQLTGEIPSEIGNLESLTILYLYVNELSGEVPSEIGNLSNLIDLHLSNNQLSGEIPPEIMNLGSLNKLILSTNQLTAIPESFCNIKDNLNIFSFSNNKICGELPSCLTAEEIGEQDCP